MKLSGLERDGLRKMICWDLIEYLETVGRGGSVHRAWDNERGADV